MAQSSARPSKRSRKPVFVLFLITVLSAAGLILWPNVHPAPQYFGVNKGAVNEDHVKTLLSRSPAAGDSFRVIAFGDNRAGTLFTDHATKGIFESMREEPDIAFAINTGDVSFDSRESDYNRYKRLTDLLPFPMLNVLGNHDVYHEGRRHFRTYLGKSDFTFVFGSTYFIFYDNGSGKFDENQIAWLKEKLEESRVYPRRIVVTHRPPFNPHYDPSKPLDFENFRDRTGWWEFGETFQKLYEEYRVDLVVAGHFHYFDEQSIRNVRYITTGGGGIIITEGKGGFLHYVVITISPDGISYELRNVEPPLWEYLFYYVWKDAYYRIRSMIEKPKTVLHDPNTPGP